MGNCYIRGMKLKDCKWIITSNSAALIYKTFGFQAFIYNNLIIFVYLQFLNVGWTIVFRVLPPIVLIDLSAYRHTFDTIFIKFID